MDNTVISTEKLKELFIEKVLGGKPFRIISVGRQDDISIIIEMHYGILLIFRYYGENNNPEYRVEQIMGPRIEDVVKTIEGMN